MNILIFALDFKPYTGGIAEYTHQIASHLYYSGDNVIVLSKLINNYKEFDSTCPYKVYRYDFESLQSANRVCKLFKSYKLFKKYTKLQPADIIICNFLGSFSPILLVFFKVLQLKFVIFTYALDINSKFGLIEKLKRRIVLRGADKVFCISSFAQSLVMKFGVPRNRTAIIPPGVSIRDFKANTEKYRSPITSKFGLENKKVILTLGRLIERKGNDMVIKALPKILREISNAMYLIVGEGSYEIVLKELAQEYKVEDHVIFAGKVSESIKQDFYDACDVFAMPCRELENGDVEGFGIVFSEANACCKPVIGGKSGGVVDAVKNNETGLLVNPLDIDEIANAIICLLINSNIAKNLGKNGRKRVERDLDWRKLILKTRSELKSLI